MLCLNYIFWVKAEAPPGKLLLLLLLFCSSSHRGLEGVSSKSCINA